MSPELAVFLGMLAGAAGTLAVTVITTRAEERKHHRALIYQAGIENFKEACEMARKHGGQLSPMEDFIINMAKTAELLANKPKFTASELTQMLKESLEVNKQITKFRSENK